MRSKNLLLFAGKVKMIFERARVYLGWAQFLMIAYMFLRLDPLQLHWTIWLLLIVTGMAVVTLLDVFGGIWSGEMAFTFSRNPEWRFMKEKLISVEEKVISLEKKVDSLQKRR